MTQADAIPRAAVPPGDAAPDLAGRIVFATALAAGLCGAWLGLGRPAPHPPVESAQVLAGLVAYPADAPFRDYHLRAWTAINQLSALALKAGIEETSLNLAWSAASGSLLVAAVVLVMLAAGGRPWPALFIAPLAVLATTMLDDTTLCYRIVLWGTMGTYGAIALPYCVVGLALVACGCRRTGLAWLGLAPAVHVGVGTATLAATVLGLAWERRIRGPGHVPWRWLAFGLAASLASWAVHRALFVEPAPPFTPEEADLWRSLIARIDTHRIEVPWETLAPVLIVLGLVGGAAAGRTLRRTESDPGPSTVLFATTAILAAIGVVGGLLTHVQPQLPMAAIQAMPGRYANAAILLALPCTWGTAVRRADRLAPVAALFLVVLHFALDRWHVVPAVPTWIRWTETVLVALAAWRSGAGRRTVASATRRERLAARGLLGLTCVLAAAILATGTKPVAIPVLVSLGGILAVERLQRPSGDSSPGRAGSMQSLLVALVAVGALLLLGASSLGIRAIGDEWSSLRLQLADYRSDPFWRRVHDEHAIVLPPWNVRAVQLRAAVPVTIDDSLVNGSGFAYSPAGVGRVVELVRSAYGIDLLAPGFELRRQDAYDWANRTVPAIWRSRSTADWQQVAAACGFRAVLSTGDCPLDLPLVVENGEFALYRVPPETTVSETTAPEVRRPTP